MVNWDLTMRFKCCLTLNRAVCACAIVQYVSVLLTWQWTCWLYLIVSYRLSHCPLSVCPTVCHLSDHSWLVNFETSKLRTVFSCFCPHMSWGNVTARKPDFQCTEVITVWTSIAHSYRDHDGIFNQSDNSCLQVSHAFEPTSLFMS